MNTTGKKVSTPQINAIFLAQYNPQEDMKAFVQRVDQFMYRAKKNGKDRVYSELTFQQQLQL